MKIVRQPLQHRQHANVIRDTILLILPLLCVSCSTVTMGRKIDPEIVKKFEEGKTTRAMVMKAIGEPFMRQMLAQGRQEMWTYMYSVSHAQVNPASVLVPFYPMEMNMQQSSQTLTLTFNGDVLGKIDWLSAYGLPRQGVSSPPAQVPQQAQQPTQGQSGQPPPEAKTEAPTFK